MSAGIAGFIIGFFIGSWFGLACAAILMASRDESERRRYEEESRKKDS